MYKMHLYLANSTTALGRKDRTVGYVRVMPDGEKRFWKMEMPKPERLHAATLLTLRVAAKSLNDNYEIHIHGEDSFVLSSLTNGSLQRWKKSGYHRSNGQRIRDAEQWEELEKAFRYQKIVTHVGKHIYLKSMLERFENEKRLENADKA